MRQIPMIYLKCLFPVCTKSVHASMVQSTFELPTHVQTQHAANFWRCDAIFTEPLLSPLLLCTRTSLLFTSLAALIPKLVCTCVFDIYHKYSLRLG